MLKSLWFKPIKYKTSFFAKQAAYVAMLQFVCVALMYILVGSAV